MSKSSPGGGFLGRLPPSTRPYKAEGSAPISSFAQYDPVIIEHMLNSEDPAKRRDAFLWLVNYLRKQGRVLPVLAMLADWLDPEATAAPFRLTINRRGKGQRRTVDILLWARNSALHYLTGDYRLSEKLRYRLTQVVHGYIGGCDADAARKGLEWMRERYRERGQVPTF